jgi:hypothetical protein
MEEAENNPILAFNEFLKGTHRNSTSDIQFLPKDVLEMIWKEYIQKVDFVDLIKFGINKPFFEFMLKKKKVSKDLETTEYQAMEACCEYGNLEVLKWLAVHAQESFEYYYENNLTAN